MSTPTTTIYIIKFTNQVPSGTIPASVDPSNGTQGNGRDGDSIRWKREWHSHDPESTVCHMQMDKSAYFVYFVYSLAIMFLNLVFHS